MKLQLIAAAILATSGAAHASLAQFASTNSELAFMAVDNTGTSKGSVFVDLGLTIADFGLDLSYDPQAGFGTPVVGGLSSANSSVVWNFANNTITKNSVLQTGQSNNFSAVGAFLTSTATQNSEVRWSVIAGAEVFNSTSYALTTGTPTNTNLGSQDGTYTSNAVVIGKNTFLANTPGLGNAVDNSSYFAQSAADTAFVNANTNMGANGNWATNVRWNIGTVSTQPVSRTNLWLLDTEGAEHAVGNVTDPLADTTGLLNAKGTFTYDRTAQTLTWQTATVAAVPEPSSYALAFAGLAVVGAIARRRRAAK